MNVVLSDGKEQNIWRDSTMKQPLNRFRMDIADIELAKAYLEANYLEGWEEACGFTPSVCVFKHQQDDERFSMALRFKGKISVLPFKLLYGEAIQASNLLMNVLERMGLPTIRAYYTRCFQGSYGCKYPKSEEVYIMLELFNWLVSETIYTLRF
jgi:hypothetical protein